MDIRFNKNDIRIEGNQLIIEITPELEQILGLKNKKLSEFALGKVFTDCDGVEYIVCEQFDDGTTGVVTKDILSTTMNFGENNNWKNSKRREWLNSEYYDKLSQKFGAENIIPHKVDLLSMDGYDDYGISEDMISDMTFDSYRKYHKYIGDCDTSYYLATPDSTPSGCGASYVLCVDDGGDVGYSGCGWDRGVRPFCILKSSIFVSAVAQNEASTR